jgi:hypothetical protein
MKRSTYFYSYKIFLHSIVPGIQKMFVGHWKKTLEWFVPKHMCADSKSGSESEKKMLWIRIRKKKFSDLKHSFTHIKKVYIGSFIKARIRIRNTWSLFVMFPRSSVPDPVGFGPFWSDPDVWDRIRALRNILTFLVCVQAINTSGISVVFIFLDHEHRYGTF